MSYTYPTGEIDRPLFHRPPMTTPTGAIRSSGRLPRPTVEHTADDVTTTVAVPVWSSETITDSGADYGTMSDDVETVTYRYRSGPPASPVGPSGWPTRSGDWPLPVHHTAVSIDDDTGRRKVLQIAPLPPGTLPPENPAPSVETVKYGDRSYIIPRPLSGPTAAAMLADGRKRDRKLAASRTYYRKRARDAWGEAARLDRSGASDSRVIAAVRRAMAADDDVWTIPARTVPVKSGYGYRPIAGRGGDVLPDDVTRRGNLTVGGRTAERPVGSLVAQYGPGSVTFDYGMVYPDTYHPRQHDGSMALGAALMALMAAPSPAPERWNMVPTYHTVNGHRVRQHVTYGQDAPGMPDAIGYASHAAPTGERIYGSVLDDTVRQVRRLMALMSGDWSAVIPRSPVLDPATVAGCLMAAMGCPVMYGRTWQDREPVYRVDGPPARILKRGKGTDRAVVAGSTGPSARVTHYRSPHDGITYRGEAHTGKVTGERRPAGKAATADSKTATAGPARKRQTLTRSAARDMIRQRT